MASPKAPAFSGRSLGRELRAQVLRCADQSAYIKRWKELAPRPALGAKQAAIVLYVLGALALLLAVGLLWQGPTHSLSLEPDPAAPLTYHPD